MELVVYVGLVVVIHSLVFAWFLWSNRNSLLTNWPVVGMIPSLLLEASRIHDFLTDILQQSNGTFFFKGTWYGGMDALITSDPMNVRHIFSKNFSNYPKGPEFNEIFEALGDGFVNADFDNWRIQRNMIHSLFKDKKFELSIRVSIHKKISNGLFSVLDHACEFGKEVDIKDTFQRFTFDNICLLVLGMDPNSLSIEFPFVPFEKAFDDIGEGFLYRHMVPGIVWKLQRWLRIGEEKKMTRACQTFDDFVEEHIKTKQENLEISKNMDEFDALTYFMQVKNKNQEAGRLSNKFLRDMVLSLLVAGRDTVSASLSWTFWIIGTNPLARTNILKEMEQHFGTKNDDRLRFFDFEKLKKLVYLHAFICEILRLYPPVPFEHKISMESDVLPSGHRVSKNTKILFSLYSMGRMKEIWGEDCLEFKPERWISESGGIKNYPSYKFIAFNSGPRSCLGKDLAYLQMKAVICAILWNYSFELVEGQNARPSISVILHQKDSLRVRVSKRN